MSHFNRFIHRGVRVIWVRRQVLNLQGRRFRPKPVSPGKFHKFPGALAKAPLLAKEPRKTPVRIVRHSSERFGKLRDVNVDPTLVFETHEARRFQCCPELVLRFELGWQPFLGVDNLTKGFRTPLCFRPQPRFGSMVVVNNEKLTANPNDDLNRVLFELPAFMFRLIGDPFRHIGDLFHSYRALQGPEFSEVAGANGLMLGRQTNRRFICNGWLA